MRENQGWPMPLDFRLAKVGASITPFSFVSIASSLWDSVSAGKPALVSLIHSMKDHRIIGSVIRIFAKFQGLKPCRLPRSGSSTVREDLPGGEIREKRASV